MREMGQKKGEGVARSRLRAVQQARFPIPACRCPFGAWPAIGVKVEKRGLSPFALLPSLQLLASQVAQALPVKGMAIDDKIVWLRHDRSLSLLGMGCIC
jgi:hypothetical protein